MVITIPSLKSGDTLFITLGDIAHGKKLQYLFIACWKSIIASFIDNFTQKKRDLKAAEGQERQEKLQGWWEYFVFNALSSNYKGGLYVAKYEPLLSQTLDRWYKRVPTLNMPPCIGPLEPLPCSFPTSLNSNSITLQKKGRLPVDMETNIALA